MSRLSDSEQRFPGRHAGIASLVVLLILTGCASQRSVRQVREGLSDLKVQVEELRKSQEMTAQELARTVGELKELDGRLARRDQEEKETARQFARVESRLQEAEEAVKGLRSAADDRARPAPQPAQAPLRCYRALGDAGRARDVWQQLIQDHSGGEAARKARALRSSA